MKRFFVYSTVCLLFIFSACNKDVVGPDISSQVLTFNMTDDSNKPLEGVSFHYIFKFNKNLQKPNKTCPATHISYEIPPDTVDWIVNVYNYYSKEKCLTFNKEKGIDSYVTMNRNFIRLTNGIYEYELIYGTKKSTKKFYTLNLDYSELMNTTSFTKSNDAGKIILNTSNLGIGDKFPITGPDSPEVIGYNEIKDEFIIILCKDGYQPHYSEVKLGNNKRINLDIKLIKNK